MKNENGFASVYIIIIILVFSGITLYTLNKSLEIYSLNTKADTSKTLPKENAPLVSISKTLNLSGKNLTKAPDYIFDQRDLEELNLSNNSIGGALQSQINNLQNLKVLNLSNNKFTGVPAEIGQLKNLEVLDLSNNQITGLPSELGNLSNLKTLNLKGNNYSLQDLNIIKSSLPKTATIILN
jgi:Leucine-rich repeat (LRR) protein